MGFPPNITGKEIGKFLLVHGTFLAAVGLYSLTVGCLLRRLTGISCPGCGLSRAYLACLRLDFAAAFTLHPLFPLLPPYLLYMLEHYIFGFLGSKKLTVCLSVGMGLLLIGVWLVRVLLGDPIVAFCPEEGLISKIFLPFAGK